MIILASKSPRRQELLKLITTDFEIRTAEVDETLPQGIKPADAVLFLSEIKARPFAGQSDDIIIGADTVVALDGMILGKPESREAAKNMLRTLSGREHSVFTGVTLIKGSAQRSFYVESRVKFYELSEQEIADYAASGECDDKAGAYGIQGRGSLLVESISGDYFNIVGLPVAKLYRELKKLY